MNIWDINGGSTSSSTNASSMCMIKYTVPRNVVTDMTYHNDKSCIVQGSEKP